MEGKSISGHPVQIKHLDSVDDIPACHLLFAGPTEDGRLEEIMKKTAGRPILTVGESEKFPNAGGIFRFFIEDHRIRFEINLESTGKSGLKISSKLISLARVYKKP
jgi:hypothetical protein